MCRNQLLAGVDGQYAYAVPGFGFGVGLAVRYDWGSAAMRYFPGEMTWSGISGTALFVQPGEEWFAVAFTSNMATRMMARMEFRRAAALAWRGCDRSRRAEQTGIAKPDSPLHTAPQ